jgi:arylsulfatase A-like enzyme
VVGVSSQKPNVFILAVDSLRADVVNSDRVNTPNFDEFAARGATFTQCVATSTTTTPSFSSILTGSYPQKHGVRGLQGYRLSTATPTLAEVFKKAGYTTYAEVTGPLLPETGVLRGFDQANHRPGYRQPFFGWREGAIEKIKGYGAPWLMLLHIWEVHRPFRPPPDHVRRFDKEGYELVVEASDEWLGPVFDALPENTIVVITGDHGEEYVTSELERIFLKGVRGIRKVFKPRKWWPGLDAKLSGVAVGHGFGLHEPLVRVPLIICGPGLPPARVDDQVRHVDLLPTLADLAGVEVPSTVDGRSLRPLVDGGSLPPEPAYMEAVGVKLEGNRIAGVRTPDWKLLKPGAGKPALYRLNGGAEPDEKHNLIRRHPEVASRLEAFLEELESTAVESDSAFTKEEEALVEQHLSDLGYL